MAASQPGLRTLVLVGAILGTLFVGGLWIRERFGRQPRPPAVPATRVALAESRPATLPVSPSAGPGSFVEVVSRAYPNYPATQPLAAPLTLDHAGHFLLHDPVYLDSRGCLWITRSDGQATQAALGKLNGRSVFVVSDRVLFAHWTIRPNGDWGIAIVRPAGNGNGFELVSSAGVLPIGQSMDYDWSRAFSWDERIVVPTSAGVCVFIISSQEINSLPSPPLAASAGGHAPVQIAFAGGPLAWIPPSGGDPGSSGAVRIGGGAWVRLGPEQGWPAGILHVIPLLDGSIQQLIAGPGNSVKLTVVRMENVGPEVRKKIAILIEQLSDLDPSKRESAYKQLTQMGPSVLPIAEQLVKSEGPEARSRLKALLRAKSTPLLGDMELVDGTLRLVGRLPDGGALFYSERGVSAPRQEEGPQVVAPAWMSIRPGRAISLLPAEMVHELDPDKCTITAWYDEWIVTDEVRGPRRYMGEGDFMPLLRKDEREYSQFIGIDAEGRYLFRKPARIGSATRPATQPDASTLILDPRLSDPNPRLPVWLVAYPDATTGWDDKGYPAAKSGSAYALHEDRWNLIDEAKGGKFYSSAEQAPAVASATTRPTTQATTGPTTAPSTQPAIAGDLKPLLADNEGNTYYDGRSSLKLLRRDGSVVDWLLPAIASGDAESDVHLVRTTDGVLFVFNQPGRVLRIRPTPAGPEPFRIEGTFARRIPNVAHPRRIWVDPLGRICIAYDTNRLAILFPQGYIPRQTATMMTAEQLEHEGE